jgi:hypothetical protein
VTLGPGIAQRFAVLVVVSLMAARILTSQHVPVVLGAVAVLALTVAEGAGFGAQSVWPYFAAGLIACGVALVFPRPDVT